MTEQTERLIAEMEIEKKERASKQATLLLLKIWCSIG